MEKDAQESKINSIFKRVIRQNEVSMLHQTRASFPSGPRMLQMGLHNKYGKCRNCDTLRLKHLCQCSQKGSCGEMQKRKSCWLCLMHRKGHVTNAKDLLCCFRKTGHGTGFESLDSGRTGLRRGLEAIPSLFRTRMRFHRRDARNRPS